MVKSVLRSWFDWTDRKDNAVFWHQRVPIWLGTRAAVRADSVDRLPALQFRGDLPAADGKAVLLACCDEGYFYRFAPQLAASALQASAGLNMHIHIYEPSGRCLEDAAMLRQRLGRGMSVSYEPPGRSPYRTASRYFFAAGRFAIAHHLLERCGTTLMVVDVDGTVRRDLAPELGMLEKWDVGLIRRPARKHPWRKILACAVLINPTSRGRLFSRRLAASIERALRPAPRFHVDQIVLHYLCEHYRRRAEPLRIADLGERWADHHFHTDSLIWTAKGNARKLELAGTAEPL